MVWTYWALPVLWEVVYFSWGTPWTRKLVVVNTLNVDFMYMYKEMPASVHTGVWEDFWRRKQLHFGGAECNIHCDRGDLHCMYEYQLSVEGKILGGPGLPIPTPMSITTHWC